MSLYQKLQKATSEEDANKALSDKFPPDVSDFGFLRN